jgi:hypothetical protein
MRWRIRTGGGPGSTASFQFVEDTLLTSQNAVSGEPGDYVRPLDAPMAWRHN